MKKSRRTFAVLCTLLFTICVFSVTAFAQETVGQTPDGTEPKLSSSEVSSSASKASSVVSSKASSASSATSSAKPSSSKSSAASSKKATASANTQQSKVNQAASRAQAAVSDPDVLSSQNWGALLSSTASTAGTASAVSSAVSAPTNNGGGVSWLLIVGILLILLGAAGIGFFIYLQFFSGPKKGHGGPAAGKGNEPTEFVDINSSSDGIQHRELEDDTRSFDKIRPAGTVNRAPAPRAPQPEANPQPAPRPQSAPRPAVPSQGLEPHPRAQAEPVKDGKDFDWEKFFNENK